MDDWIADRYRLVERIGSGGMAEVWRAQDVRSGRDVAVKRMHPHLTRDAAARDRFRREVVAASSVNHPLALRILDAGLEEDAAYLVMEHAPGGTLADRLDRGPLGAAMAAAVGADVAAVLAAVHGAGLVHRDVTPANILFAGDGRARLGDYGIARPIDAAGGDITAAGDIAGTLRFVAPEVLAGTSPTPASDVWSLGVVLYEAISGRPPFDASSPAALIAAHREPAPALPPDRGGAAGVVAAMLDPRPPARPTAAQVALSLRHALGSGPDDETVVMAAPAGGPPDPWAAATQRAPGRPRVGRRVSGGLVVAALALAIAFVAAMSMLQGFVERGWGVAFLGAPAVTPGAASTPGVTATPGPTPTATHQAISPGPPSSHRGGHGKGKGRGRGG